MKTRTNTRWMIGFLMFTGMILNYLYRVNISFAIIMIAKELSLTPFQQGIIMSSFSWGYVVFMILGGILIDKYGTRIVLTVSSFLWSIFTALGAVSGGFITLLLSRFLLGTSESPISTGNAKNVRSWFPLHERGKATSLFDVGSYVGSALAAPLVAYLIIAIGWRSAFYLMAIFGLVWSYIWFLYYREPEKHFHVSKNELKYIQMNDNNQTNSHENSKITTWELLKYRQIKGMALGFFCYNYLKNFFLTWFPSYLVLEKGFSLIKAGVYAFIPPVCAIIGSLLAGHLTDVMIQKGISVTVARKLPLCIGFLLSTVIILAIFAKNPLTAVILLTISYTGVISASTGIWGIPGDIAPNKNYVGRIGGVQNTFSNMAGIIAPIVTGWLYGVTHSFVYPLAISGFLAIVGAFSYWFIVGELKPMKFKAS